MHCGKFFSKIFDNLVAEIQQLMFSNLLGLFFEFQDTKRWDFLQESNLTKGKSTYGVQKTENPAVIKISPIIIILQTSVCTFSVGLN